MLDENKKMYFPRNVDIVAHTGSGSKKTYEFLAQCRDEVGALARLAGVMADNNVNLFTNGGFYSHGQGKFIWAAFADLTASKSPVEDVVSELKHLSFVIDVQTTEIRDVLFDHYLFPVMMNGQRASIFQMAPLLRVGQRLLRTLGSGGLFIMFEEGRLYALEVLKQYAETLPLTANATTTDILLRNAEALMRNAGWGLFRFDASKFESVGTINVVIVEPPIAAVPDCQEDWFTNGAAAGIIEYIFSEKVGVISSKYDGSTRTMEITFKKPKEAINNLG